LPPVVLQKETRPSASSRSRTSRAASITWSKDVRRRVEVEDQPAGDLRLERLAVPRVQLHRPDLGHGGQGLDAVDLQVGLVVAEHLTSVISAEEPLPAWRWKNRWSPPMPSGMRMIEQGRPLMCGIIHSPTASK
jgi:hypothetical protein